MLSQLLRPPSFDDEEKTQRAYLLHTILIVILGGAFFIAITTLIFAPERQARLILMVALSTLVVANLALLKRGRVQLAGSLSVGTIWIVITIAIINGGGFRGTAFPSYIVVVVLAGMVLGQLGSYFVAILSFLVGVIIIYAETQGVVFPAAPINHTLNLVTYSFYLTLTAVLLHLASGSIQKGLKQVYQGRAELAVRNQILQTEMLQRERIEENLRKRESQLRLAVGAAKMRVWEWEFPTGKVSAIGSHVTAVPDGEETFEQFLSRIHPDDRPLVMESIQKAYNPKYVYQAEYRVMLEDGSYNWVESIGQVLYDGDGAPHVMRGISLNITDRKEAEQQRLELALQRERVTLLSEFMSNISHDLRTPLTVINTTSYLLERMLIQEEPKQKLQQIKEQTALLSKYVEDILTMSRLDSVSELPVESVDLNRLVGSLEGLLRSSGEHKNLRTAFDLVSDNLPIMANPDDMTRAVSNLIENAVRYTPESGSVTVRTRANETYAILEVADTGIGISENDLPRIFTRFYRAEKAKSAHREGTGLGLAIVKKIVERHRGLIEVESQPGEGSIFRIYLPFTSRA